MALDLDPLPPLASWQHRDARDGFEALKTFRYEWPWVFAGHTTGVEEGRPFAVGYYFEIDREWHTHWARVWSSWPTSWNEGPTIDIRLTDVGRWTVDGVPRPDLDGCHDVDLESSACTNALPLRRLALEVGESADAPAVYVRREDLAVERLEQRYERRPDDADGNIVCHYVCERFEADFDLTYDRSGLILDYPGLATRVS